ncbi:hypothetical protein HKX48_005367 [Thoreauomyces humboldtii]|nr:hypothetical protein HKX48_005367 [Thoreauomyces humboldtii]
MKSFTALLAICMTVAASAAPIFSWQSQYFVGGTYVVSVDFGMFDTVPNSTLTFAYGPAQSTASQSAFTDIGPGTIFRSATARQASWTVGVGLDPAALSALEANTTTYVLAVHNGDMAADGTYTYWAQGPKTFTIGAAGPNDSTTLNPLPVATSVGGSMTIQTIPAGASATRLPGGATSIVSSGAASPTGVTPPAAGSGAEAAVKPVAALAVAAGIAAIIVA